MSLRYIVYSSHAVTDLAPPRIRRLAESAAAFNQIAGITGVLLFDGARFVQYIEGPADGMEAAFGRIKAATCHTGLKALADGRMSARLIPYWEMQALNVPAQAVDRLIQARWQGDADDAPGSGEEGMSLLLSLAEASGDRPGTA